MRIAIDIASGDKPARDLVPGVLQGARETDAELLLVGDRTEIEDALGGQPEYNIEIVHSSDVIGMAESPVRALIAKPEASVAVACSLVASGRADMFLSPGNTGACLVVAAKKLGNLPGIRRPALIACIGRSDKPLILLDVGASAEAKPGHLAQFAVMGAAYVQSVFGTANPRVGLLNNGTEPGKGCDLQKRAYHEIEKTCPCFAGNIEGFDLFSGKVDVAVTDGFTGNVLVKSIAAATASALSRLEQSLGGVDEFEKAAIGLREQAAQKGGVPLLGIKGGCIVLHGRAGPEDIAEAIRLAAEMIRSRIDQVIAFKMHEYEALNAS